MSLSAERLRAVLRYDRETGIFTRFRRGDWRVVGAATGSSGYVVITIDYKPYLAHRLAWLYAFGDWPKNLIDHINRNKLDNRLQNLRDVGVAVNSQNRIRARKGSKSGVLGVSFSKVARVNPWRASISTNGKRTHLGNFETIEAASNAYLSAKRERHLSVTP